MDRPRTFAPPIASDSSFPNAPQILQNTLSPSGGVLSTPVARAAAVFAVVYVGLGVMPQAWPLEKMYSITMKDGSTDPKKKVLVAALSAAMVYYLSHYMK